MSALLEGPHVFSSIAQVDVVLSRLLHFPSSRAVLQLLLTIIQGNHSSIRQWSFVWFLLCVLRDATLLPLQMVSENEEDLLPAQIRSDFEYALSLLDKAVIESHLPLPSPTVKRRASTSLFDVLFGNNHDALADKDPEESAIDVTAPSFKNNLPSAKWDGGYDGVSKNDATGAAWADKTPMELLMLNRETVALDDVR